MHDSFCSVPQMEVALGIQLRRHRWRLIMTTTVFEMRCSWRECLVTGFVVMMWKRGRPDDIEVVLRPPAASSTYQIASTTLHAKTPHRLVVL